MKIFTKRFVTLALVALSIGVCAQTVLTLPKLAKPASAEATAGSQQRVAASTTTTGARQGQQGLISAQDQAMYEEFTQSGQTPASMFAPLRNPDAPEDSTVYTYTGFNQSAGLTADGNVTGGWVNFNLQPFACDTVKSSAESTPYSYVQGDKLYTFAPVYNYPGGYTQVIRTTFNANTLEQLDQKTFDCNPSGDPAYVPYLMTYDDQRDVVWVISMGDKTPQGKSGNTYYLNILDTATCKLQRLGMLGYYDSDRSSGNYAPKAFVAGYGTLYVQLNDGKLYIGRINPVTLETTIIGATKMPTQYVYGQQPMIYNSNSGNLLVNHYDFNYGTQYYQIQPFVPYGSTEDTLKTTLVESLPTGFTYFYQRPETQTSFYKYQLANVDDMVLTVDDSNTASIAFTVPAVDVNGDSIEFPSWASHNARVYIYVDNNYTTVTGFPSTIELGSKIEGTFPITNGMHIVTVQVYPMYNSVGQSRTSKTIVVGYDAPAQSGNPTLSIIDMVATITWDAPTVGRYDDFGSTFDATDLTYTVVRDFDSLVVAENITETKVVDNNLPDEFHTYTYTVYATSHEQQGLGAQTNAVTAGLYMPLPYENNFDEASCIEPFTIINANNDGSYRTWNWNHYYYWVSTSFGVSDDWLITPPFALKADSLYMVKHQLTGQGNLIVTYGQGNTIEAQDTELETIERSMGFVYGKSNNVNEWKEYFVTPAEDGYYNFGFHAYNNGDNDFWRIDSMLVCAIASTAAPGPSRSVEFTPDAKGALGGTFTFNLPSVDIKGNTLSSLTRVTIYDMYENALATSTSVTPGAQISLAVTAQQGWNQYVIVAANEHGEGYPVVFNKFVGPDVPKPVTNLKATWGEEQNEVHLTWTATTEGVNGGYVDVENLNYKLYKYTGGWPLYNELATTPDDDVDVQIMDASSDQAQYIFGVTAVSEAGESDYTRVSIILGTPYELPFVEPFAIEGLNHAPYVLMTGKNGQAWTTDEGHFNEKIQPQNGDSLQLVLRNTGSEDGSGYFESPIISFAGAEHPVLSTWLHHSDGMPEEAYATVVATIDGSADLITVSDTTRLTGNSGWVEHLFDLSALNGKKAQIALCGYMPNASVRIFNDNWNIYELSGKDLALSAISQPYCPVMGDKTTVEATVTNRGAETATGYTVMFNLNGETIEAIEATEALAPGASATFQFPLSINAGMDEIIYYAEVEYDGDEVEENNVSSEVELTPEQLDLPAPKDLTIDEDKQLNWVEPDKMDGREVTLTFEDVPAFTIDNINGWTTFDGDGHLTTSFIQYYGNYWPYCQQPLAWMVWSAVEAGAKGQIWFPYEGEKCLIAWGNYGADAEGRDNSSEPEDDWFISPEVKGGTDFSFMTLSNDVNSTVEVLVSTTDREPSSFTTLVQTVTYNATGTWSEVSAQLPKDAKYVALHVTQNGFGLMVDNIKYTEAKAPELLYYNIYHNSNVDATATQTAYDASGEAHHTDKYGVSAVYDLGESELTNLVTVSVQEVYDPSTNVRVIGGNEQITVLGADGRQVSIFTVAGQQVAGSKVAADSQTYRVASGVYIVNVNGKAFKVLVK